MRRWLRIPWLHLFKHWRYWRLCEVLRIRNRSPVTIAILFITYLLTPMLFSAFLGSLWIFWEFDKSSLLHWCSFLHWWIHRFRHLHCNIKLWKKRWATSFGSWWLWWLLHGWTCTPYIRRQIVDNKHAWRFTVFPLIL